MGVFGNNDQDEKDRLLKICKQKDFLFEEKLKIRISEKDFLFAVHDPNDIEDGFYKKGNIIVHGHTHRFRDEIYKETHIFNPGECAGMMKGMNKIGIIETDDPKMEIISFQIYSEITKNQKSRLKKIPMQKVLIASFGQNFQIQ